MFGSSNKIKDLVLTLYQDNRSVFRLKDIALLTGETNFPTLNRKLNYHVRTGKLLNPRKGIYAKPGYQEEEFACTVFTPSYISLEYVLQKAGIVFQYDSRITSISYLSRTIHVDNQSYLFRKIKDELLVNTNGIVRKSNQINIATAERAFLDLLYLAPKSSFDNLNPLNKEMVFSLLPHYQSISLTKTVTKLLQDD